MIAEQLLAYLLPHLACAAIGIAAGYAYATWSQRRRRKVVPADSLRSIGSMRIGETGWVVPWAIFEHAQGFHAKGSFAVSPIRRGMVCLQIERTRGGIVVVDSQWAHSLTPKMSHGALWPADQPVLNMKHAAIPEGEGAVEAAG